MRPASDSRLKPRRTARAVSALAPFAHPAHEQPELLDRLRRLFAGRRVPRAAAVAVRPRERLEPAGGSRDGLLARPSAPSRAARGGPEKLLGRVARRDRTTSVSRRSRHSPASSAKKSAAARGLVMARERYQRLAPRTKCAISSTAGPHPDHHGPAHDAVADVELLDLGYRGHRDDVLVGEAVARVDEESHVGRVPRGATQLVERGIALAPGVRVATGVQLDRGHAEVLGGVERGGLGVDEQAHPGAGLVQPSNGLAQAAGSGRLRSSPPSVVTSSRRSGTMVAW